MMKLITYQNRSRLTWPRSAAHTPNWHVTLDSTRMIVFTVAYGMSSSACGQGLPWPRLTERMVKYIANSAAKNMSSEDNQTIVPTWTRLARRAPCGAVVVIADAVATPSIIAAHQVGSPHDPPISPGDAGRRGAR